MTEIRIIGAGGHGKVVADLAEACGFMDIAFLDDSWPKLKSNGRWAVVGKPEVSDAVAVCSVGNNKIRKRIFNMFELDDSPVLVHPSSTISPTAILGSGTVVVAGSIVNADARIGQGVILNTACSVDHDCEIEDFVHISPGARLAGNVCIGECSWIGIGAVVREGVIIGRDVIVAAGAVVINDLPDGARVAGIPAEDVNRGNQ